MSNLATLQQWLKTTDLKGLLISSEDEYQNEMVPDAFLRLQWATSFTGSKGVAVILRKKAAIFVDSRYTIQAEKETRDYNMPVLDLDLKADNVVKWIKENLTTGEAIGFDPKLHTISTVEKFSAALEEKKIEFRALDVNPIDTLWRSQPAAPATQVYCHPLKYAGKSSMEKRQSLAESMTTAGLDFYLITVSEEVAWLLNVRAEDVPCFPVALSFALLHDSGAVTWFIDPGRVDSSWQEHLPNVEIVPPDLFDDTLKRLLAKQCVGLNMKRTPFYMADTIRGVSGRMVDSNCIEDAKGIKNTIEIEGVRKACQYDDIALIRFLAWLKRELELQEITELTAAQKVTEFRSQADSFREVSFPPLSSSGAHGAIPHYFPSKATDTVINGSGIYLLDSGGQYPEGTTDITRTIAVNPPSESQKRAYTLVLKGHIALATTIFPEGTCGYQLDAFTRQFLWEHGMNYGHGTGHGVGSFLNVHEGPGTFSVHPIHCPISEGMIMTIEPGFYETGEYGVRIENMIVVQKAAFKGFLSFETLAYVPMDALLVDFSLLSEKELAWLKSYHLTILDRYTDQLTPEDQDWLRVATEPFIKKM